MDAGAQPLPTLLTFTVYANDDWAWADDLVNAWTRIWSLQPG